MTQYDAAATPLWDAFTGTNTKPFTALLPGVNLNDKFGDE
jgi:hypothetical protein